MGKRVAVLGNRPVTPLPIIPEAVLRWMLARQHQDK